MIAINGTVVECIADMYLTAYTYALDKVKNPNLAVQCGYCIVSCYMDKLKMESEQQKEGNMASLGLLLASMAAAQGSKDNKKTEGKAQEVSKTKEKKNDGD